MMEEAPQPSEAMDSLRREAPSDTVATAQPMDRVGTEALLAQLRASEERLALASAAANLGVWDVDIHAGTGIHNREFRALYGLPQNDQPVSHGDWLKLIHPEDRERMHRAAIAAQAGQAEYSVEFRITRADTGEVRWIASKGSVVKSDLSGQPSRMVGVCYDITERRREEERQTLLAREVDHRAKNVLAVVQSIVRLTSRADTRDFAKAVEGRVAALGRAHTLLSRDHWVGARIAEVVREELLPYGDGDQMVLDGPDLSLGPHAVQPFSMFLHELATNAAKYGALSRTGGRVKVSWRLEPTPPPGPGAAVASTTNQKCLTLRWEERGGPPIPAPPETRGFGTTVITSIVRGQLEGRITKTWTPDGLDCEVVLPSRCIIDIVPHEQDHSERLGQDLAESVHRHRDVVLHGRRVLLAEDEPLLGLDMGQSLAAVGCNVIGPLASIEQTLRTAASEGPRLDAAILDANLRGFDTAAVAELLGAFGVPVVHVTGYGTRLSAAVHGAQIILRKPLHDGDLITGLRMALFGRQISRR